MHDCEARARLRFRTSSAAHLQECRAACGISWTDAPQQQAARRGPSQFEKFDQVRELIRQGRAVADTSAQIVSWLFQQSDAPVKGVSTIVDRLARNFRINLA